MKRRFRPATLCAGLVLAASACARAPSAPRAPARTSASAGKPASPGAGRFVALPDARAASWSGRDQRGTRLFIVGGQRVALYPDGRFEGSTALFEHRSARALELPRQLGGGYLFYLTNSGATSLWRARTWTAELEPFALVDFEVDEITAGFNRIYLTEKRSGELLALDPETGKGTDLGALPAAPAYVGLAFASPWFGAVDVPFRGVLASFDAGATWRTVEPDGAALSREGDAIVLSRARDQLLLDPSGALKQRPAQHPPPSTEEDDEVAEEPAPSEPDEAAPINVGPLGAWPLRAAVLYGWPLGDDLAVVLHQGALARVSLRDGAITSVRENALPAGRDCSALRLGAGVGFVCHREDGGTAVYRLETPLGLAPFLQFPGPRYVAGNGRGDLVVRGGCSADDDAPGNYCLVSGQGQRRQLAVRGDVGAERVVALHDGRAAVLVPPRLGVPGRLTLVTPDGQATTVPLRLPRGDAVLSTLLGRGLWLDGVTETKDGKLSTWVVGGVTYAGVRVALDGKVEAGRPGKRVGNTFFNGQRALEIGSGGLGYESLDGGMTWSELEQPLGLEPGKLPTGGATDLSTQGCSPVGCAAAGWLRVGWWGKRERQRLPLAERPEAASFDLNGGGRWSFSCSPTGPVAGSHTTDADTEDREVDFGSRYRNDAGQWPAFLGVPPPARRGDGLAVSQGSASTVLPVRGYAWGPAGAGWPGLGRWLVRVADRFAVSDRVWSTADTRAPWPDSVTAAQTFGQGDAGSSYTQWTAMLDPAQPAGALLIKARGTTELYIIEQGRSIAPVANASSSGLVELAGAVEVGDAWYIGTSSPQNFRVLRVERGRLVPFAELPARRRTHSGEAFLARVVRATESGSLGIWVQVGRLRGAGTAWYVIPLDPRTGAAGEPLELDPAALGTAPGPCPVDADGWLLEGRLPIEPFLQFAHGLENVRAGGVEGRLIVDASGAMCLDGLAATAEGPLPGSVALTSAEHYAAWAQGKPSVPLTLRSGGAGARRVGLRCTR